MEIEDFQKFAKLTETELKDEFDSFRSDFCKQTGMDQTKELDNVLRACSLADLFVWYGETTSIGIGNIPLNSKGEYDDWLFGGLGRFFNVLNAAMREGIYKGNKRMLEELILVPFDITPEDVHKCTVEFSKFLRRTHKLYDRVKKESDCFQS